MAYQGQGLGALGSGLSGIGSAFAAKENARAQRALNDAQGRINQKLIGVKKRDVIHRMDRDIYNYKTKINQTIGSQRAKMAALGLDLESGSALDIQMDTAWVGAQDEITIRTNAWKEAFGLDTQSLSFDAQNAFSNLTGRQQANSAMLAGTTSAFAGGMKFGSEYGKWSSSQPAQKEQSYNHIQGSGR